MLPEGHRTRPQARHGPQQPRQRAARPRATWPGPPTATRRPSNSTPSSRCAHYNLGNVLDDKGDRTGAAECYKKAIELDPKYALGPQQPRQRAVRPEGPWTGAAACYKKAIELDPKYAQPTTASATCYDDQGDLDGRRRMLQEGHRTRPQVRTTPTTTSATCLTTRGTVDGAIANATRRPSNSTPSTHRPTTTSATCCTTKDELDGAAPMLQEGHRTRPQIRRRPLQPRLGPARSRQVCRRPDDLRTLPGLLARNAPPGASASDQLRQCGGSAGPGGEARPGAQGRAAAGRRRRAPRPGGSVPLPAPLRRRRPLLPRRLRRRPETGRRPRSSGDR